MTLWRADARPPPGLTLVSMLAPAAVAVVAVAVALRRIWDCAPSAPAPATANRPT